MKQYRITTDNIPQDSPDDAHLSPEDPIHELKIVQYLAGLGASARLQEYRAYTDAHNKAINKGSNISLTGNEKSQLMKQHNIQPGTPEWFKLWFSRPFLTDEKPIGK
jgi:hypothetical protein